jgi:hypothetical protein
MTLKTQQLEFGPGDKTKKSSSTANVSQYGTPVILDRILKLTLVSVFSSNLKYLVVGDTLTKGLPLTYISTYI